MERVSVGIYYGSTTGNTRRAAEELAALLEAAPPDDHAWASAELLNVADYLIEEMPDFDLVVLALPTWNIGQMQRDWEAIFDEFDSVDLSGVPVALLGLGDQVAYAASFVDAMAFLAEKVLERGATLLGAWPADGYTFTNSWALRDDGRLVGLVLDEENQAHLNEPRLREWAKQLRQEYAAFAARQA